MHFEVLLACVGLCLTATVINARSVVDGGHNQNAADIESFKVPNHKVVAVRRHRDHTSVEVAELDSVEVVGGRIVNDTSVESVEVPVVPVVNQGGRRGSVSHHPLTDTVVSAKSVVVPEVAAVRGGRQLTVNHSSIESVELPDDSLEIVARRHSNVSTLTSTNTNSVRTPGPAAALNVRLLNDASVESVEIPDASDEFIGSRHLNLTNIKTNQKPVVPAVVAGRTARLLKHTSVESVEVPDASDEIVGSRHLNSTSVKSVSNPVVVAVRDGRHFDSVESVELPGDSIEIIGNTNLTNAKAIEVQTLPGTRNGRFLSATSVESHEIPHVSHELKPTSVESVELRRVAVPAVVPLLNYTSVETVEVPDLAAAESVESIEIHDLVPGVAVVGANAAKVTGRGAKTAFDDDDDDVAEDAVEALFDRGSPEHLLESLEDRRDSPEDLREVLEVRTDSIEELPASPEDRHDSLEAHHETAEERLERIEELRKSLEEARDARRESFEHLRHSPEDVHSSEEIRDRHKSHEVLHVTHDGLILHSGEDLHDSRESGEFFQDIPYLKVIVGAHALPPAATLTGNSTTTTQAQANSAAKEEHALTTNETFFTSENAATTNGDPANAPETPVRPADTTNATFQVVWAPAAPQVQPEVVPAVVSSVDLPFKRDEFRNHVFEFVVKHNTTSPVLLEADCSEPTNPFKIEKPGYIIGLWDDKKFESVDKIKCQGGEGEDIDDSREFADDVNDDVYFELDPNQNETIDLNSKHKDHKPLCPLGYLLTGLKKTLPNAYNISTPVEGTCLKLIRGKVDYDTCEPIGTVAKDGGNMEPYLNWNVECTFGYAAIGMKVDGKRVKSLRCCKLTRSYI